MQADRKKHADQLWDNIIKLRCERDEQVQQLKDKQYEQVKQLVNKHDEQMKQLQIKQDEEMKQLHFKLEFIDCSQETADIQSKNKTISDAIDQYVLYSNNTE